MEDHIADGALVLLPTALQIAQRGRGKERGASWSSFITNFGRVSSVQVCVCAPPPFPISPKPPPLVP